MSLESESIVRAVLNAFNRRSWEEFVAGYAPDATIVYPQSGERFQGRESIRGMVKAFPSPPTFTVTGVRSGGELVVVDLNADYGAPPVWKACAVYLVRDGSIVDETAYFAAPFEAADWRAPFRS